MIVLLSFPVELLAVYLLRQLKENFKTANHASERGFPRMKLKQKRENQFQIS